MRKPALAVAIVGLLAIVQTGHASNLQAGWYVKLAAVSLWGCDRTGEHGFDWNFTGELGTQGPFAVTSPDPVWAERMVTVTDFGQNGSLATSVYLWGTPEGTITIPVERVNLFWETDYDASHMRLELLMYKQDRGFTALWTQAQSGVNSDFNNVLTPYQQIPVGYVPVFRVTALPEPTPVLTLPFVLAGLLFAWRRRI